MRSLPLQKHTSLFVSQVGSCLLGKMQTRLDRKAVAAVSSRPFSCSNPRHPKGILAVLCVASLTSAMTIIVLSSIAAGGLSESYKLALLLEERSKRFSDLSLRLWAEKSKADCLLNLTEQDAAEIRCCLRSMRDKLLPMSLTRKDSHSLYAHGFSKTFLSTLPDKGIAETLLGDTRAHFKTCAVVSNAPSLRLHNFSTNIAKEIDQHDAVFRLNKAPIAGYEHIVGSKETVRIINLHYGVSSHVNVASGFSRRGVTLIRDEQFERRRQLNLSRSYNVQRFSHLGALDEFMALRRQFPKANILLNHPIFSELSLKYLHSNIMGSGHQKTLSTGAQAVVLALLLCDKVTSYEIASADILSKKHHYYWDISERSPYKWWHPFEEESGLLQYLASSRRGNSSIYTYEMTGGCAKN